MKKQRLERSDTHDIIVECTCIDRGFGLACEDGPVLLEPMPARDAFAGQPCLTGRITESALSSFAAVDEKLNAFSAMFRAQANMVRCPFIGEISVRRQTAMHSKPVLVLKNRKKARGGIGCLDRPVQHG